jgi:hypothetical protein
MSHSKRIVRSILALVFVAATAQQTLLAEDTCSDGWETKAAKIPGAKAVLSLSTAGTNGEKTLRWPNPNNTMAALGVFKAKAPIDAQGNIAVCATGPTLNFARGSILLRELQRSLKLDPGYYALRVEVRGVEANHSDDAKSNWIVVQIPKEN